MTEDSRSSLGAFLQTKRDVFLNRWEKSIKEAIDRDSDHFEDTQILESEEFGELFDAYIDDMLHDKMSASQKLILKLVRARVYHGFSLSMLEFINASFMATARELFRETYPDAFNTRMEFLERLSQMVLSNEIALAQYYETYLNDLNAQLRKNAEALERRNQSLVQFLDLATHQLQSPLWSILGFTSKLQRRHNDVLDDIGRHCLDRISANVSEMHQLIEDLIEMLMIDRDDIVSRKVYLRDLLSEAVDKVTHDVEEPFACEIPKDLSYVITGDPRRLRQAFYQVLKNSALYTHRSHPGKVSIKHTLDESLHLFVTDQGIGVDPKYRELVFKPMERLKEKEVPGSGMGLTFARKILAAHGALIEFVNSESDGACIHIQLPSDIVEKN